MNTIECFQYRFRLIGKEFAEKKDREMDGMDNAAYSEALEELLFVECRFMLSPVSIWESRCFHRKFPEIEGASLRKISSYTVFPKVDRIESDQIHPVILS
jgi:hypothetical protein